MVYVISVLVVFACWAMSLRRTPWPLAWGIVSMFMGGIGILIMSAVLAQPHHTIQGVIGGEIGAAFLPMFAALCTELTASAPTYGSIRRYREGGEVRRLRVPVELPRPRLRPARWTVDPRPTVNNKVDLWVVCPGAPDRYVGSKDPVKDMGGFMDLRAEADLAVETLNALKIGSSR